MILNAIVFDLELVKRFRKGQLSEIVEIGACKVDLKSVTIIDQFQIYTLPKSGYLSKSTRKFIKIKKEDIKNAVPFHIGIEQFTSWLGTNYFLCSWGKDDKAHIINQCVRNRIQLDWFKNYNDIQKQIGHLLSTDDNNQMGLKNALNLAEIEPIGKAHRGIDDAINTAQLLMKFIDQLTLNFNSVSKTEISRQRIKNKQIILQNKALKLNK
jgi:inhibitor of KinA sporulation pathway (predicted exonuclease)